MTNAKRCCRTTSTVWRSLWMAFLAIIIAISPPSIPESEAQQREILPKLQTSSNQVCKLETPSSGCNACNTCQSEPRCPSGYTVYDDYCLPECPAGYLRYPGSPGVCTPPSNFGCPTGFEPVPLPSCPDGYYRDLRNPEQCLPDQSSAPDNCPAGLRYLQETGKCSAVCPDGTYLAGNGLCRSAYERECPDGYNRNPRTGACVPGGDWPDDYKFICMPVCPEGLTRDIYQPTRCVPPPDSCPVGFEKFREQCVPVCEQGTQRNSYGYCQPPRCEDGSYPDFRGNCRQPECPEGYDNIRGLCYQPCDQGFTRNPNNPGQCERIPTDEPDCPDGTKLNTQTNECERVPPPPPPTVKCKQGLEYNPRTKQCEPPPRVETTCPKGFTKLKSGKCQRIVEETPQSQGCPRNFVLNRNTGECEPIRLNVPKACPEGTEFSRRRQRCVPMFNEQEPEFEPQDDDGEPELRLPKIDLNNNLLNEQKRCPKGTAPDNKGRCVPLQ